MSNTKIVYDCSTGTTSYVPLSAVEIAEIEANKNASILELEVQQTEE